MPKKEEKKIEDKDLTILERLVKARGLIRKTSLKKSGTNTYSKYDYFTPEQVENLVADACEETKMIALCNLMRNEHGLYQTLDLVCIDDPMQKLHFELATEKGAITATSDIQQMGGTDTYSERYIKMKVFQIKDNNLDPDSKDNSKVVTKKDVEKYKKPVVVKSKKAKIMLLLKGLGHEVSTKEQIVNAVKQQTDLSLVDKNFDEIISRLQVLTKEK